MSSHPGAVRPRWGCLPRGRDQHAHPLPHPPVCLCLCPSPWHAPPRGYSQCESDLMTSEPPNCPVIYLVSSFCSGRFPSSLASGQTHAQVPRPNSVQNVKYDTWMNKTYYYCVVCDGHTRHRQFILIQSTNTWKLNSHSNFWLSTQQNSSGFCRTISWKINSS